MLTPSLSRLRLKDLQLLQAIASVRSLTVLARSTGTSQPALSRSLREIEDQLGVTMFSRDKSTRLESTPMGRLVLNRIELLLTDADALQSEIQAFREGTGGYVRLGIIPYIPSRLASHIVRQLTMPPYRMSISTYEASTDQLVEALKHQTLDAVLGRLTVTPSSELHQEQLLSQSASILVHEDSALLSTAGLRLEMLADQQWILPPLNSPTRQAFAKVFQDRGLTPPVAQVETTSARLIHSLTRNHVDTIGLVPLNIGRELQGLGGVRYIEFPFPFKMPDVGLIVLASRRSMAAVKLLRGVVRNALDAGSGLLA